ncbi:MAG: TlyA family RNA methyltransferase, partial [Clostridiales bacterium]|nr:TlyA family RNA methyltransferase [Clostridiales bacterium]
VKLEAALDAFAVNLDGLVCADIGASTGGFTDLMLKRGASKIYAIDSGSNQLAEVLRNNNRVISLENTDIRDINNSDIPGVDFLSVDVSFISLSKIICVLYKVLKDDSFGVILIKPQFEAGPGVVNKKGVIKNPKIHYKTLIDVYNYTVTTGFAFIGLILSPITGRDGNREFLGLIRKAEAEKGLTKDSFSRLAESLLK